MLPLIAGLDIVDLLAVTAIVAAGAAVQATIGFGYAMLGVPLLALIDTSYIPGPSLTGSMIVATLMGIDGRRHVDVPNVGKALLGQAIGTVIGVTALAWVARDHLPELFGGLILAGVALSLLGVIIEITTASLLSIGTLAGVMGTMAGLHGPPFALLYQRSTGDDLRANLAVIFWAGYVVSIIALAWAGLFGTRELMLSLTLAPGVLIGFALSRPLSRMLDEAWLRPAILILASASALILIVRG